MIYIDNTFIEVIKNKIMNAMDSSLDNYTEKRIILFTEIYRMLLSYQGRYFLLKPQGNKLRTIILNKIEEFSENELAQQDVNYMSAANDLYIMVKNIQLEIELSI